MAERVELHDAFFFICPECGKTGWVKALRAEMSEEEKQEMQDQMGGPGCMMMAPNSVKCERCKMEFEAFLEGEPEEGEDGWEEEP